MNVEWKKKEKRKMSTTLVQHSATSCSMHEKTFNENHQEKRKTVEALVLLQKSPSLNIKMLFLEGTKKLGKRKARINTQKNFRKRRKFEFEPN